MRSVMFCGMSYGLLLSAAAVADGYYSQDNGPGSINWPPPGGTAVMQPASPAYGPAPDSAFRPYPSYQQNQRLKYQPTRQFRNELIKPPGTDWPNAAYYDSGNESLAPEPTGQLRPEPEERGAPVEVVPPPSIPIEEVSMPLSKKPERGWRPMKEQEVLKSMEETVTPPKPAVPVEPVMRKVEKITSPLQAPESPSTDESKEKPEPVMREVKENAAPRQETEPSLIMLRSGMSIRAPKPMAMPEEKKTVQEQPSGKPE